VSCETEKAEAEVEVEECQIHSIYCGVDCGKLSLEVIIESVMFDCQ
jgi:hypothetical protein